jgi:YVTN family beta-propeller protein
VYAPELQVTGYIDLPAHDAPGGFDHADILGVLLYIGHTANNAVDVVDIGSERYLCSLSNHIEAAGVLASREKQLLFVSNRGDNTVSIIDATSHSEVARMSVGVRPNGLAYDAEHDLLLVANVGDPTKPETHTVSLVSVARREVIATIRVAGRTRWVIYAPELETFFVNIAKPPQIVAISRTGADRVARVIDVPSAGPHGLAYDAGKRRLFCACDARHVVAFDAATGAVTGTAALAGVPDVVFFNPANDQLYVAIGEPGCVQVIDTVTMHAVQTLTTEPGAKTTAFDATHQRLYVFLPASHRAMVLKVVLPPRPRP